MIPSEVDYSISLLARIILEYLRANYSITDFQAKELYNIDALPLIIEELLSAGHLIRKIKDIGNDAYVRAYTLYEFKDHEPKVLEQIVKIKQRLFSRDPMLNRASQG